MTVDEQLQRDEPEEARPDARDREPEEALEDLDVAEDAQDGVVGGLRGNNAGDGG